MSASLMSPPEQASLDGTEEVLSGMMRRLRALVGSPALTQEALVEVTAIYNNVAYIFLYLESNAEKINYDRLLPWRAAFYDDPALDARLLAKLDALRCPDPEVEEAREAFIAYLRQRETGPDPAAEELEALIQEAKAVLRQTSEDQVALLARLRAVDGRTKPTVAFYKLVSGTPNPATRAKLARVWQSTRDARVGALADLVDRMVQIRREQARRRGFASPLAQTLQRCGVTEDEARSLLDEYLTKALASHAGLKTEIADAVGVADGATDHFGYYVRQLQGDRRVPLLAADGCLDFACQVGHRVFGLDFRRAEDGNPHVVAMDVTRDGEPVGRINFDLWDAGHKKVRANHTKGVLNRADFSGIVQRPIAYVSCLFQPSDDGVGRITFQNAHSLFHEFGHAVNHLLIRKRVPNRSGLEYLPLERLENLSMWFEKWVYHEDFADSLGLSADDRAGLSWSRQVKMLEYRRTHVDRAVTAALDFDVHSDSGRGVREAFARLDERFAVSRFCTLGDFPAYFTWPMFQANPGAYFAYLWGAADSAEKFGPFLDRHVADLTGPAEGPELFSDCLDFDEPSTRPDVDTVFGFYDAPLEQRTEISA